jgi:hypothetical protein
VLLPYSSSPPKLEGEGEARGRWAARLEASEFFGRRRATNGGYNRAAFGKHLLHKLQADPPGAASGCERAGGDTRTASGTHTQKRPCREAPTTSTREEAPSGFTGVWSSFSSVPGNCAPTDTTRVSGGAPS